MRKIPCLKVLHQPWRLNYHKKAMTPYEVRVPEGRFMRALWHSFVKCQELSHSLDTTLLVPRRRL
jgi:hypothetical protein